MIRINLLGVSRPVARAAEPSEGIAPEAMFIPGALLVVLLLISGLVYWSWTRDIAHLNLELVEQQNEQRRLAGIMEQNKIYEQRLNQLQLRIKTTDALHSSRVGPVELMRSLGNLADRSNDLYLLSITTNGDRVAMNGEANSAAAVATFVGALQHSGIFEDVQLKQSFEDDQGKRINFKFNLDCSYRQPTTGTPTVPAVQSGAAPAAAGRQAGL